MLLGPFTVSAHAIEMYDLRAKNKSRDTIIRSMKHDLRTLNIKNIVRKIKDGKKYIHIFTRNSKEFIFADNSGKLHLVTFIERTIEGAKQALRRRGKVAN